MSVLTLAWLLPVFVVAVPCMGIAATGGSYHDSSRLLQLGALLLGTSVMLPYGWMRPLQPSAQCLAWAMLLTFLALASVMSSDIPSMAWRELAVILGMVGVVAGTSSALVEGGAAALSRFSLAALAGCTLYSAVLCLLILTPLFEAHTLAWPDLTVGYDNYRFFNHVQTVALPLLALQAQDPRRRRSIRAAAWLSMAIYWSFVFCSGARGTAVAIALAMVVCIGVIGFRTAWPMVRTMLSGAAAGAVAYAALFILLPARAGFPVSAERTISSLASDNSRQLLWQLALEYVTASPWLGVGPMHYAHFPNPKAAHPHNVYLQIAAEWGIPMLLAIVTVAGKGLRKLRQTILTISEDANRNEGVGLFIACVAILADGAVSGNFVMPVSQMWIAYCLAWAITWIRLYGPGGREAQTVHRIPMTRSRLLVVGLVLSQVWLISAIWQEALKLDAHVAHVSQTAGDVKTKPRFWSAGWF
ncbi:O-antigen ligase family protein [Ideonella sp. DXS29W]|uniref:O-antigen ligase family protein n=1 Tax=Ideonella lacteola TaxID=2984193 RepID=A0ABU9BLW9_9BURK